MIEAPTIDIPMNDNRAGDQMIPMPETMPLDAYRGKSYADNLNYPQSKQRISSTGGSMPTPKQETWKDWLPPGTSEPDDLFTRQEILDMANAMRLPKPITERDLRLWEQRGVLPRAIRRKHAMYPRWYANLIRQVRLLQRQGYTLAEIAPRIRTHARMMFGLGNPDELEALRRASGGRVVSSPGEIHLTYPMVTELEQMAHVYELMTGIEVVRAEVHLIDADGRGMRYPLPLVNEEEATDNE